MPREMTERSMQILTRGMELVNSVNYQVSARWLFYRLLQESYFSKKSDYKTKLIPLISKARKDFIFGWHPATLSDDTRQRISKTGGAEDVQQCINSLESDLKVNVNFDVDHFYQQEQYVEIWFEAKAMSGQFRHYTNDIDLLPFGGYASIPYKYNIAQRLQEASERYGKPITVLYFGDLDYHGETILDASLNDIEDWCAVSFDVEWCGLTEEQAIKYNVPQNPDRPGEFQWEALSDQAAGEIITNAVAEHVDLDLIETINEHALEHEHIWRDKVDRALETLYDDDDD